jgi:hypothetical protein
MVSMMREIKGTQGKRVYARKTVAYNPQDEATIEDLQIATKVKSKAKPVESDGPRRIDARPNHQLRSVVPGSVWRCASFKWDPLPFVTENERLEDRVIETSVQQEGLSLFTEQPDTAMVYGVSGNPSDEKAKLFAAYLVGLHLAFMGNKANVLWHTLYGGFDNKIMKDYDEIYGKASPTILVLSNLTPNSTSVKLEKARDLIERFCDIPRIIVNAGEDPMSFLTTRLYVQVNAVAYFSETLVKKRIEII